MLDISPYFGIEAAVVRVERPDHNPVAHAESQLLANPGAAKALRDAAARDDLRRTRPEHPALHDAHLGAKIPPLRCQAANDHVGRLVRITLLQGDQHDHFLRYQDMAVRAIGNLGLTFHDRGLRAVDAALHFRSR